MTGRRAGLTALVLAALLAGAARGAPAPARVVSESEVHEVAGGLRCVVCQNLSVADSPSEMARQMRAIVRERLEAGESPGEVVQYFVDRYGEWILLSPRRSGFNLLVWAAPLVAVAVGLAIVSVLVRRWARAPASSGTALPVDPAMRERIRRETEAER
ncbi:MAG: cytochrome C biogenesis protein CcdA [Candidatus Rokuibacteriota bacterium]|nr:MAG: cytochrome C biogenesis protein CcdA [Candidatus Rokubacteria bacterium]